MGKMMKYSPEGRIRRWPWPFVPVPSLLHFEEDSRRLGRLQEENDVYRQHLESILDRRDMDLLLKQVDDMESNRQAGAAGPTSMDLMDDFFVISQ